MAKKTEPKPKYVAKPDCQDCKHSYDPHSRALDGHMILCRCPFHTDRSRFMLRDGCDMFQKKR